MHAREYSHRHVTWIVTDEHLVDLEDRTEFSRKCFCGDMRQVEIYLILTGDTMTFETDLEDLAGRDIPWNKIAVCRIFLFEEVPTFRFWDIARAPHVTIRFGNPDTSAFTACRFAHQPKLVFARDGCRMDLDELPVRVPRTLLITRRHGAPRARHRVRGFSED